MHASFVSMIRWLDRPLGEKALRASRLALSSFHDLRTGHANARTLDESFGHLRACVI